jgi:OOP family OmpA-OmpF porin
VIAADTPLPVPNEANFLPSMLHLYDPPKYELWNALPFPDDSKTTKSGKHWYMAGKIDAHDKMAGYNMVKSAMLAHGWTLAQERLTQPVYSTWHFSKGGVEAWSNISTSDQDHVWIDIVEPGPLPYTFTLSAPQANTPEKMEPEKGDFPYLAPLPGSTYRGGRLDTDPFRVTPEGAKDQEVVATGSMMRSYNPAAGTSVPLFMAEYQAAVTKAGWVIVKQSGSDSAGFTAHYTLQGRNIWASFRMNVDGYSMQVADAGGKDLAKALSTDCHVALYGVLFDFNKATLQAASDPVLKQVQAVLTADKTLKIEVQGHTDNVGTDAYNQTLSEARARAVVTWLTTHGVAADRMSAKGYGKTKPVADNNTDEGQAKNRRVEIANPACAAK